MKRLTFKNFFLGLTLCLVINGIVEAADVNCTKDNGYFRPTNKAAKIIVKYLGNTTCSGPRFFKKVKELGLTTNAVPRRKKAVSLRKQLGL